MRKSILLFLSTLCTILSVNAQITKGSILLGGSAGYSSTNVTNPNTSDTKSTQLTISPSIGIAIKDNNVIGLLLDYGHTKQDNQPHITDIGGGIFWRKYLPLSKSFYFFTNTQLSYGYFKWEYFQPDNTQVSKTSTVYLGIYPGVTYVLSKKFHLEASLNNLISLGYTHTQTDVTVFSGQNTSSQQNSFSLQTSVSSINPFNFGFRFLLAK